MEVGNGTGIQPDYLRKKGNKKRQIPAMGNWRNKNTYYSADLDRMIMLIDSRTSPEEGQGFF